MAGVVPPPSRGILSQGCVNSRRKAISSQQGELTMKKILAVLYTLNLVLALSAVAADKKAGSGATTYQGWITDQKCTAGAIKNGKANTQCAKKCIEDGTPAVF